jgi:phosphopantothenoylcysteine decarboxylase/phosphopantothenate--cysteine ligase
MARGGSLAGVRIVVTAGPTREHLDDIRFLSNASTGRMGHELARAAARRGATVTLVLGPSALEPLANVCTVDVESTQDLLAATRKAAAGADVVIFAAAPADWRPARRRRGKPARAAGDLTLDLRATPDVAATLGKRKGGRLHVGFALEVGGGVARARRKLAAKRLDAIVLNGPANLGEGGGAARWITEAGRSEPLPTGSKPALARAILDRIAALLGPQG